MVIERTFIHHEFRPIGLYFIVQNELKIRNAWLSYCLIIRLADSLPECVNRPPGGLAGRVFCHAKQEPDRGRFIRPGGAT